MKRRLLATLLSLAMVLTMLPVSAFAAWSNGITVTATSLANEKDATKTDVTIKVAPAKTNDDTGTLYYKPGDDSATAETESGKITVDESDTTGDSYKALPEDSVVANWPAGKTKVVVVYATDAVDQQTNQTTVVKSDVTEIKPLAPRFSADVTAKVDELAVDPTEGAIVTFAPTLDAGSSYKVKKVTISDDGQGATEDITEDDRPAADDTTLTGYDEPGANTKGKVGDKFAVAVVTSDAVTAWGIVTVTQNPATVEDATALTVTRATDATITVTGESNAELTGYKAEISDTALTKETAKACAATADATGNVTVDFPVSGKVVNVVKKDAANNTVSWGTAPIPAWVKATIEGTSNITGTNLSFLYNASTAKTITVEAEAGYKPVIKDDATKVFTKGNESGTKTTYTLDLGTDVTEDVELTIVEQAIGTNPGIAIATAESATEENTLLASDEDFVIDGTDRTKAIEVEADADTLYVTLSDDAEGATTAVEGTDAKYENGTLTLATEGDTTFTVTVNGVDYVITITKKALEPTIALYAGDGTNTDTNLLELVEGETTKYTATTDNDKVTLKVTNGTATEIKAYKANGTTELQDAVSTNTVTLDTEADTTVIKFTVGETNYTITVTKSSNAKTVTLKWSSDITVEDADGVTTMDYTVTNAAVEVNVTVASTKKVQLKEAVDGITVAAVDADQGTYKVTIATSVQNGASAELEAVDIQSGSEDEVATLKVTATVNDDNVPSLTVEDASGAPVSTYKYKVTATATEPTKPEANADTTGYTEFDANTPIDAITANSWVEVITVDGEDNITAWGKASLVYKAPVVEEKTATLKWVEGIEVENASTGEAEDRAKEITTTNGAEVTVTVTDTTKKPATTATGVTITEGSEAGKWTVKIPAGTTGEISLTLEDNTQTDDNTVNNDTEVTDGVATGSVEKGDVDKAVNAAVADDKATEVELNFTADNADDVKSVNIEIPKAAVNSVATAKDENGTAKALDLVVNTPVGSVTLPSAEVKSINNAVKDDANATKVVLVIEPAKTTAVLPDDAQAFEIAFHKDTADGDEVAVNNPVNVTLKTQFVSETGLNLLLIEGTRVEKLRGGLTSTAAGLVTFRAPHLSSYGFSKTVPDGAVDGTKVEVNVGGSNLLTSDKQDSDGTYVLDDIAQDSITLDIPDSATLIVGGVTVEHTADGSWKTVALSTTAKLIEVRLAGGEVVKISAKKAAAPVSNLTVQQTNTVIGGFAEVTITNMQPGHVYVVEATNGSAKLFNLFYGDNDPKAVVRVGVGNVVLVKEYTQADFNVGLSAITTMRLETERDKTPIGTKQ